MSGRVDTDVTTLRRVTHVEAAIRQQARATRPTASVWVSASAGSGKTTVLTNRVLRLLLAGAAPNHILCLTFTKAAAAEMANRIAKRLSQWVTVTDDELLEDLAGLLEGRPVCGDLPRARRLFAEVQDAPGGLRISTLHAFCQSLLRRFPLEAGVAPHFTLIEERDAGEALDRARERTIGEARTGDDAALAAAMNLITARVHETNFGGLMGEVIGARSRLAALLAGASGGIEGAIARVAARLGVDAKADDADIVAAACDDRAFDREKLTRVVDALRSGSESDRARADAIVAWLAARDQRAAAFDDYMSQFITGKGEPRKVLATKAAIKAWADAGEVLLREAERLVAIQDQRKSAAICQCTAALLRIGARALALYSAEKKRHNLLDYDDLIQTARRLLERPGLAAWVLYKLDGGLEHVLVDEAQDTSADQWSIIQALTAEFFTGEGRHEAVREQPRTQFVVGDRKQSIYSFQGADPRIFDLMHRATEARVTAAGHEFETVPLQTSFRSVEAVLRAVDAVFAEANARAGVAHGDEAIIHIAKREGQGGLVEIWPAVRPAAEDDLPSWKPPVERVAGDVPEFRLAGLIAKRILGMLNSGERLISRNRPIRAGDIMVLVRRRTGFVEELVRRLKQAGIGVAGVDRMVLTEQLAVMDLMALGQFLLLPADDLTLATVLKSPLIGFSEDELFALAHGRGDRRLWDVLRDHAGSNSRFGQTHRWLEELLARTDYMTPAELFAHVLVDGDGRRKILARLGAEADDPLDEFLRLALSYQQSHAPALEGFLHWLARGQSEIKRDLEQSGADAVRIITVHGAKGLQAPIVFLPDTTQSPRGRSSLLWTADEVPLWPSRADAMNDLCRELRAADNARHDEEYRRLLYVAMTRAEDRLYVCGWHTRRPAAAEKTWYGMIEAALGERAPPVEDHALARDADFPDGNVLRLECPQTAPPEKSDSAPVTLPEMALPVWARTPAPPEQAPPRPLAPSQALREDPPVLSPLTSTDRFQRGLLIHRLLQSLPEVPVAHRRSAGDAFLARALLSPETRGAILDETMAVLEAPAFAPLFAPGSRAEVPITGLVGGYAVAGQVDRLAVTADDVWIVDYKTNRPPAQRPEDVDAGYVFQMAVYRAALAQIYPRHRIRCVILWTDGPFTLELTPAQMAAALAAVLPMSDRPPQ